MLHHCTGSYVWCCIIVCVCFSIHHHSFVLLLHCVALCFSLFSQLCKRHARLVEQIRHSTVEQVDEESEEDRESQHDHVSRWFLQDSQHLSYGRIRPLFLAVVLLPPAERGPCSANSTSVVLENSQTETGFTTNFLPMKGENLITSYGVVLTFRSAKAKIR